MGIFLGQVERRQFAPEPPIPPYPGAPMGGSGFRRDDALTVPTVWACVLLKAGTISSLPLVAYKTGPDVPVKLPDPPLLRAPSGGMTQGRWLHMLETSLMLRGNAYGRISARDSLRRATQVDLFNPDALTVTQDPDSGELIVKVTKTQKVVPAEDLWHVPWLTFPGQKVGMSPIGYAAAVLGIDISSRTFAGDFFDGGGIPKAILKSAAPLDQKQASEVKSRLMAAFRGREPIVVPNGIDYLPISVKPEESQFLSTQGANVAQIARFFGVPPRMVGGSDGNSMTYANVEQLSLDFLTYGLAPDLKLIEDAISQLLPNGQYVEFDVQKLLRTDAETAAKVDLQYLAGKVYAPSEIRQRRGEPPMTQAQKDEAELVPLTPTAQGGVRLPAGKASDQLTPAEPKTPQGA